MCLDGSIVVVYVVCARFCLVQLFDGEVGARRAAVGILLSPPMQHTLLSAMKRRALQHRYDRWMAMFCIGLTMFPFLSLTSRLCPYITLTYTCFLSFCLLPMQRGGGGVGGGGVGRGRRGPDQDVKPMSQQPVVRGACEMDPAYLVGIAGGWLWRELRFDVTPPPPLPSPPPRVPMQTTCTLPFHCLLMCANDVSPALCSWQWQGPFLRAL